MLNINKLSHKLEAQLLKISSLTDITDSYLYYYSSAIETMSVYILNVLSIDCDLRV